jgi:hypothetical protein
MIYLSSYIKNTKITDFLMGVLSEVDADTLYIEISRSFVSVSVYNGYNTKNLIKFLSFMVESEYFSEEYTTNVYQGYYDLVEDVVLEFSINEDIIKKLI